METFLILEEAWAKQNVTLVDLKSVCGLDMDGNLLVADVIDYDSWRIWRAGDKRQMKDKENYRIW
jgi:phosphoribosylaminoimidazole-succinocarboxamide synthase